MHGSSLSRMAWFARTWPRKTAAPLEVLDVGSCEVAGGSYRPIFPEPDFIYHGLDMAPGPNVDLVPKFPYHWSELNDASFDIVISGQALEHMEFFWLAALEMTRVLKPGGLLCIVAPRGFARHRYPVDCYRFDADGMTAIARWCNLEILHVSTDMAPPEAGSDWHIEGCEDSLLVAKKPEDWHGSIKSTEYVFTPPPEDEPRGNFAPIPAPVRIDPFKEAQEKEQELEQQAKVLDEMARELNLLRKRTHAYETSRSWRMTAPLRLLGKFVRQIFGLAQP